MPNLIQLRSGQFLIGDCSQGDDGTIKIKDPFEVVITPQQHPQTGQVIPQAGMFPYALMCKDREFTFKPDQIQMDPATPDEKCAEMWLQQTTGIQMAAAGDMPPDPQKEDGSPLILNG